MIAIPHPKPPVVHEYRGFPRVEHPVGQGIALCSCGWGSDRKWNEHVAFVDFLEHKRLNG